MFIQDVLPAHDWMRSGHSRLLPPNWLEGVKGVRISVSWLSGHAGDEGQFGDVSYLLLASISGGFEVSAGSVGLSALWNFRGPSLPHHQTATERVVSLLENAVIN